MASSVETRRYQDALRDFSWDLMWTLVGGDREVINIARECVERHPRERTALRLQFEDGHAEVWDHGSLGDMAGHWASLLADRGVARGDRIALILQPGIHFYAALFGILKLGAVAVPLYPLFGPEALRARLEYTRPRLALIDDDAMAAVVGDGAPTLRIDAAVEQALLRQPVLAAVDTRPEDDALIQFTSGTTRMMPQAIHHRHRSAVTTLMPAIYGYGVAAEDRYLCVSPPSWGHGLSFGTLAPLILGGAVGTLSGRFDVQRLLQALQEFRITNLSAAPTVYRQIRTSGLVDRYDLCLRKVSYTGEAMDGDTFDFIRSAFGTPPCGVYGTAEVSSFVANFCGFSGYEVKRGSLGKPLPGKEVAVFRDDGTPAAPNEIGEIRLRRSDGWYHSKDIGYVDEDGYFFHAGRNDDVIISAGWTISPLEIETVLLQHPAVVEAAVVASPDPVRGFVPKAFVVVRERGADLEARLQDYVKDRLARNQYPRRIEVVDSIPRTSAGKIDRKALRHREEAAGS